MIATTRRPALVILLIALASCAYFNTWLMARREYKDAVKAGNYDFADPYSQEPLRGEAAKLVDSCIERCGKILLLHSGSSLVDDALFMMGNCFVLKGEYGKAMRKYDELLEIYGEGDLEHDARYMKAYTLVREGKADKAVPILRSLIDQTEKKKVQERAAFLAGRIFHHDGDCESAIELLTEYIENYHKGELAGRARLTLASCMARSDMAEEAIEILKPMSGSNTADGIAATLGMGIAYRTLGEYDRSVEILSSVAEDAIEDSVRARAMIEIALTQEEKGEFETAIATLDLAAETARDKAPVMSAEAAYARGLIYERRLLDFDAAIETYGTISQQKSDHALLAKKRHQALTSLRTYREAMTDSIPDTPEEVAQNLFMMAEILIEDLGLGAEAREHLKSVADSIPQTDWGARAALRFAAMLEAEGDTLARAYQRKVIELFPNTVYANAARASLGLELVDVIVEKPGPPAADSTLAGPAPADSALVDPAAFAPPDSLSPGAQEARTVPPGSAVSPDSAWASRRKPRSAAPRDSSMSAKRFLRPPPVVPVPGEETHPDDPAPADSSGTETPEGHDQ